MIANKDTMPIKDVYAYFAMPSENEFRLVGLAAQVADASSAKALADTAFC
jgi:hypothetical protein